MDYFAGNWRGVGKQGTYQYTGRETAEWDLHHTILTHRNEFFGADFANTLLMVRMLDPRDQATINENQFASWGVSRQAQYDVIPHGDWFQLVGTCTQTGKNGTRQSINIVTVHDENHYTFAAVPTLDAPGAPFREAYSREGVAPYEMSTDQTGEHLQAAIGFFESKPDADHTKLADLKGAHAGWLLQQKRYLESVDVLEHLHEELIGLPSHDENTIETTKDAILRFCRDCAYNACMDTGTSEEDLRAALKLAKKAAELSVDDPRIWLQAFVHYRLGDQEAARRTIRESLADETVGFISYFLASMIEHDAGNVDLAKACHALGEELAIKIGTLENNQSRTANRWMAMSREVVGKTPATRTMETGERLATYQTVIDAYPDFSGVYRSRGRFHGSHEQWDQALADYRRAAELAPTVIRHREGETAITLLHGTTEQKSKTCRQFIEEWKDADQHSARMDVVLMCSLDAVPDVDRERLDQIADEVLASVPKRAFLLVAKGMSLYRLGRYEEAAATISTDGSVNPKDRILGQLFLAMAHKQLGHDTRARRLYEEARKDAETQLAEPAGPPLPYQDRPIVWCMIQKALGEAAELFENDTETGASE